MADQVDEVAIKKAKTDEPINEEVSDNSVSDAYFAKFRPDRESRCTWDRNATVKESPHEHNDNT